MSESRVFEAKEFTKEVTLLIDIDYPDFRSFYKNSKDIIYRKITDLFLELKSPDDEILLTVSARVDGCDFNSDFLISKTKEEWLKSGVKKYFEEIEDYETCNKIMKVCF